MEGMGWKNKDCARDEASAWKNVLGVRGASGVRV